MFCLPDKKTLESDISYNYYNDVVKGEFEDKDIIYGHKAFFWPPEKPSYTFTPKKRISFSLTCKFPNFSMYYSIECNIFKTTYGRN